MTKFLTKIECSFFWLAG